MRPRKSRRSSALVEEASAAADSLREPAQHLAALAGIFRLPDAATVGHGRPGSHWPSLRAGCFDRPFYG
jgi:hypothetical protein